MFRLTALFRLNVSTPYSAAKSASSITCWPQTSRITAQSLAGIRESMFFAIPAVGVGDGVHATVSEIEHVVRSL